MVTKARSESEDEDLVRLYLHDIGRYPLLTKDDEARLARAIEGRASARQQLNDNDATLTSTQRRALRRSIKSGDDAERTFVEANLRLVVHIAKKYQASGLPLLDLIQEGNLGLIHAVEKFDWRKGFKFSTYATWWIRQAVSRGIANSARTIRLPIHAAELVTAVHGAQSQLQARLGRVATRAELATELGLSVDKVEEVLRIHAQPRSLSEPLREDGDGELGDLIEDRLAPSPFEAASVALLAGEVKSLLERLDEREREILRLRYGLDRGEPRTLEEVGTHFSLTRERIRQIEARAMSKLRHPSNDSADRATLL